ncbi:hypothetical protein Zmor_025116 [Zophobas morio]|uniref:Uncharacterized protein n=1 Tax=Zophobas morio TaxID=2755281 RepID=A0AA38HQZ9_9CUCU|nr:hypothetical protein Zmor_025116 [Zophobas morio]
MKFSAMENSNVNDYNSNARNDGNNRAAEDELKRSKSVKQMITSYQQQRLTIKEALCNLDRTPSNKIVFDEDSNIENNELEYNVTEVGNKKSLFQDDDSEEDNFNFEPNKYHFTNEGQKLYELQSKFKGDRRFQLNERFLPDNKDSEPCSVNEACSLEEEKKSEINILEQVLGTKLRPKKQNLVPKSSLEKKMLRFDPTQSNHVQYQITAPNKPNEVKIKQTHQNEEEEEEVQQPLVSKDVFYQVDNDLKISLQSQQEFSLLKQFGKDEDMKSVADVEYEQSEEIIKNQNKFDLNSTNPFRYDSSDEEPDSSQHVEPVNAQEFDKDNVPFHSEPFFFKEDDFRFQDGSDFIKRVGSERNAAFVEQRRNLKHIIKAKIRNNNRKSNPFKKKLGGNKKKKNVRIKKALKRH